MTKQRSLWITTKFCTGLSRVFEKLPDILFSGMILIDLAKAFDNIEQQILLKKIKYLGFLKTQSHGLNPISVNGSLK